MSLNDKSICSNLNKPYIKIINKMIYNYNKVLLLGFAALMVSSLPACHDENTDNSSSTESDVNKDELAVTSNYVDAVILPTYSHLKVSSQALLDAVDKFVASGTQADLNSACAAWRTARIDWESSEAFLFGPVENNNVDPTIDTWPLDADQISTYLSSDKIDLSVSTVRANGLGINVSGFHTVEYLLFSDGQEREASSYTARMKLYLQSTTTLLRDDCFALWYTWVGTDNVTSSVDRALADDISENSAAASILGSATAAGYGARLKNANIYDQSYKTQADCLNQLIDAAMDITNEVGTSKIGGPHDANDVNQVESWQSWNSLIDYDNNIASVQNAYMGTLNGTKEGSISDLDAVGGSYSLSAYIASRKPDIDKTIRADIKSARQAIQTIPEPFRNNLQDPTVEKAMKALSTLHDALKSAKSAIAE